MERLKNEIVNEGRKEEGSKRDIFLLVLSFEGYIMRLADGKVNDANPEITYECDSLGNFSVNFLRFSTINNYSLKSRCIVAEYLLSREAAR